MTATAVEPAGAPLISIEHVKLSFGGVRALTSVSLTLREGEWCGLVGPNGSGKTSSLNVLSGFYSPQAGSVRYRGVDLVGKRPNRRERVGIVRTFQHPVLSSRLSLIDNVLIGAEYVGGPGRRARAEKLERAHQVLVQLDCGDVAGRSASEVSYGIRKRVEIARALASQPAVLLLDEPAAGLSQDERGAVIEALKRLREQDPQLAAIVVEHDVRFVSALCESAVALDFGSVLAAGRIDDVLSDRRVRSAFLGEQVDDD